MCEVGGYFKKAAKVKSACEKCTKAHEKWSQRAGQGRKLLRRQAGKLNDSESDSS